MPTHWRITLLFALSLLHFEAKIATCTTTVTAVRKPTASITTPFDTATHTTDDIVAAVAQPTYDPAGNVTILYLQDPQLWRATNSTRETNCSNLNIVLNKLDQYDWPTSFGLSTGGQPITAPNATVFGGDLCQTGGDYDAIDQALGEPTIYDGGSELVKVRSLYEVGFPTNPGVTKLQYSPIYFGLGNHDIQSDYTPIVGWSKGLFQFSSPSDFWRYQMWNYITQMHTGLDSTGRGPYVSPPYPINFPNIDTIDDGSQLGSFEWPGWSLNYVVDLGPVDVIQLHRYGGDVEYGRASGIDWLKAQLEARGVFRPLIIVQHYLFSQTNSTPNHVEPTWTDEQRAALLAILDPYNVIAVLVGHLHDRADGPPLGIQFPSGKTVPEIRPGAAFGQNFALLHVTPTTLDVVEGFADENLNPSFTTGQNYPNRLPPYIWQSLPGTSDKDYFGKLGGYYFDTRVVSAPSGKIITGLGLTPAWDITNRVSWSVTSANPDGSNSTTTVVSGSNQNTYFPQQGGGKYTYADANPVIAPDNTRVVGVYLYNKVNRYAPGLVVEDGDGNQTTIENPVWEGLWFPGSGGSSDLYCDTKIISGPTQFPDTQMAGVQFYQNGNRLALKVLYR